MVQKQKAAKDYNTTQLYGLAKCSAGIYTVMLFVNIELVNQKFVLTK